MATAVADRGHFCSSDWCRDNRPYNAYSCERIFGLITCKLQCRTSSCDRLCGALSCVRIHRTSTFSDVHWTVFFRLHHGSRHLAFRQSRRLPENSQKPLPTVHAKWRARECHLQGCVSPSHSVRGSRFAVRAEANFAPWYQPVRWCQRVFSKRTISWRIQEHSAACI